MASLAASAGDISEEQVSNKMESFYFVFLCLVFPLPVVCTNKLCHMFTQVHGLVIVGVTKHPVVSRSFYSLL